MQVIEMFEWNRTGQFLVIGHRGVPSLYPENTLSSFRHALEIGAMGVECDVHPVESELVVIHDSTVNRTTDGSGKVQDFKLADLRELHCEQDEHIPLLKEVIALVPEPQLLNIELKGDGSGRLTASYLNAHHDQLDHVLISSFTHRELLDFRERCPDAQIGVLCGNLTNQTVSRARALKAFSIHIADKAATTDYIRRIHDAGFRVLVYTVNDVKRAKELEIEGVFGVFSDVPQELLHLQHI